MPEFAWAQWFFLVWLFGITIMVNNGCLLSLILTVLMAINHLSIISPFGFRRLNKTYIFLRNKIYTDVGK